MTTVESSLDPKTVAAGRGTAWLGEAWRMFMREPGVWIAITVVLAVIFSITAVVPGVGILVPVFTAGLMQCSQATEENATGQSLQFEQMFAGFRRNLGKLVIVGLLTFIGNLLILIVAVLVLALIGGAAVVDAIQNNTVSLSDISAALAAISVALLVWSLLSLPLFMAAWFAPALVYFDDFAPAQAMKTSFAACLSNWLSLSIYGLVLVVLAIVATIPLALGWLALLPVIAMSLYISYRDIFHGSQP